MRIITTWVCASMLAPRVSSSFKKLIIFKACSRNGIPSNIFAFMIFCMAICLAGLPCSPKHFFEVGHDSTGGFILLELMLQYASHRGKHIATSHSIRLPPFFELASGNCRSTCRGLFKARSGEDICMILRS